MTFFYSALGGQVARRHWLGRIQAELDHAREQHPGAFHGHHEGYAVLLEEVDELWEDVKADRKLAAINEAVQVAAMALRFLEDLGGVE